MPSTEYLEKKVLALEDEINAILHTMERLGDVETTLKKYESLLTFIVGYLLSPDKVNQKNGPTKAACEKMIRKWYYGGYRSRRVSLAANELEKLTLKELKK